MSLPPDSSASRRALLQKLLAEKSKDAKRVRRAPLLPLAPRPARLPLSFAQERLWFLEQLDGGSLVYAIMGTLELNGPLDVSALSRAVGALLERHEVLRTRFDLEGDTPVQHIEPAVPSPSPSWTSPRAQWRKGGGPRRTDPARGCPSIRADRCGSGARPVGPDGRAPARLPRGPAPRGDGWLVDEHLLPGAVVALRRVSRRCGARSRDAAAPVRGLRPLAALTGPRGAGGLPARLLAKEARRSSHGSASPTDRPRPPIQGSAGSYLDGPPLPPR